MNIPASTFYLPLFFLTAWLMSNRNLTDKLKYRLAFSKRAQLPVVQRFWFYDLLFSSIAFLIANAASHTATFSIFSGLAQSDAKNLQVYIYPLFFILTGFFWPKL